MTPYAKRKTPFTQRMAEDMQVRNFSPRTIDSYTYHVDRYAKHFAKDPEQLGPEDVRNFQLWMIRENKSSWSQFNQAVCGLRFFYSITCKREWVVSHIPFGHVPKKLPNVLGSDEVASLISCINHTKHRTVVIILYAAGLRLSEALNLKLQDIDSNRMQLKVVQGKGRKDR
jgi:integrase/recombinase XerD